MKWIDEIETRMAQAQHCTCFGCSGHQQAEVDRAHLVKALRSAMEVINECFINETNPQMAAWIHEQIEEMESGRVRDNTTEGGE